MACFVHKRKKHHPFSFGEVYLRLLLIRANCRHCPNSSKPKTEEKVNIKKKVPRDVKIFSPLTVSVVSAVTTCESCKKKIHTPL